MEKSTAPDGTIIKYKSVNSPSVRHWSNQITSDKIHTPHGKLATYMASLNVSLSPKTDVRTLSATSATGIMDDNTITSRKTILENGKLVWKVRNGLDDHGYVSTNEKKQRQCTGKVADIGVPNSQPKSSVIQVLSAESETAQFNKNFPKKFEDVIAMETVSKTEYPTGRKINARQSELRSIVPNGAADTKINSRHGSNFEWYRDTSVLTAQLPSTPGYINEKDRLAHKVFYDVEGEVRSRRRACHLGILRKNVARR
ncbi:hypothetical protein BKA69DRAFT_1047026 [Paraphysoderma sedebokerense]|nr:hypothetical protein BKA69DRAFT_1047026 [Paraphysoderma sedebokerense]